jgi:light-regulated signal transduction histidine kinase (bacteriophytochrome)
MLKGGYGLSLDPEGNRLMDNIMENAKRMGQLIDDLLTFSRVGRTELARTDIAMHELVSDICIRLKKEQVDRSITFNVKHLLSARGDKSAVTQIWLNLISNAVKYSRHTEKAVVEIGSEEAGPDIIYHIKDNGAGFDMRYANKLFGVFQRLHSDDEFEGTGVGLALVQRLLMKQGGRVWGEGEVNEGAVFYFTLTKT